VAIASLSAVSLLSAQFKKTKSANLPIFSRSDSSFWRFAVRRAYLPFDIFAMAHSDARHFRQAISEYVPSIVLALGRPRSVRVVTVASLVFSISSQPRCEVVPAGPAASAEGVRAGA
jgi:hypothetical protein